ncbi:MAG TPA: glycosyltransferase family 2 protein [Chloroflexi bacterium]|nr:glycosyltransferase family 2 protein [Chloroflexota bacterium]HHW85378.1 glycosyltransferase family 2 protein [Chloroflexota bacterium]
MTETPHVAIIILNWNNPDDTLACLRSVMALDYPVERRQVIVVDNGSTDDSVARIRAAYPGVTLIETGANLGYAEGNNVGIRYALKGCHDYLLILNNDTEVQPDFLSHLVAEAEADVSIGVVGPKMYFLTPNDMVFAAGSVIRWEDGTLDHRGIWRKESDLGPLYAESPEDVDFIVGCGVLFRRQVLERLGLLDNRYYLNFEDVDICVRAYRAGYRVRYTPRAVLHHKVSASLGQASAQNTYYMTRNALLFFWENSVGWRRWRAIVKIIARNLGHIIVWYLKPEYRISAQAKRRANLLALRDAVLARFGKMGSDVESVCRSE